MDAFMRILTLRISAEAHPKTALSSTKRTLSWRPECSKTRTLQEQDLGRWLQTAIHCTA
jgi:hypothetical protein